MTTYFGAAVFFSTKPEGYLIAAIPVKTISGDSRASYSIDYDSGFVKIVMGLRVLAAILFMVWLTLVLLGKGGFVHLLLFNAIGVASVEVMTVIRAKMRA